MEITELLDQAKSRASLPSDYALAKALGISPGNLSNIRKGKAHPSNTLAVQLATLAGRDEMQVIAEIELRTANSEKKKEFWQQFLEHRSHAATISAIVLGLSILATPQPGEAAVLQMQNYSETAPNFFVNNQQYTLYEGTSHNSKKNIFRALFERSEKAVRETDSSKSFMTFNFECIATGRGDFLMAVTQ